MTLKNTIGLGFSSLINITIILLTIRLSGHRHSLDTIFIGLLFINLIAIFLNVILWQIRVLGTKPFLFLISIVILTFLFYIIFNRTYGGYKEAEAFLN